MKVILIDPTKRSIEHIDVDYDDHLIGEALQTLTYWSGPDWGPGTLSFLPTIEEHPSEYGYFITAVHTGVNRGRCIIFGVDKNHDIVDCPLSIQDVRETTSFLKRVAPHMYEVLAQNRFIVIEEDENNDDYS